MFEDEDEDEDGDGDGDDGSYKPPVRTSSFG